MEIFWYAMLAVIPVWGVWYLIKKDRDAGRKLDEDWDKKFLTDLEEWKKDHRV